MAEGFIIDRYYVYYGYYEEDQVCGKTKVTDIAPKRLKTDHPFGEDDIAVKLCDNHRLIEPEYEYMHKVIKTLFPVLGLEEDKDLDFSNIEQKLGTALPDELKFIYSVINGHQEFFEGTKTIPAFFVPLDDIYADNGRIVFFKKKRTPAAGYDISTGQLSYYYKKEWSTEKGGICCYQLCLCEMLGIFMENMPVFKAGRCKGKYMTNALCLEGNLESLCDEKYHLLQPNLCLYGIYTVYTDDMIAYINTNGYYADIHVGARSSRDIEDYAKHFEELGEITWKEPKE